MNRFLSSWMSFVDAILKVSWVDIGSDTSRSTYFVREKHTRSDNVNIDSANSRANDGASTFSIDEIRAASLRWNWHEYRSGYLITTYYQRLMLLGNLYRLCDTCTKIVAEISRHPGIINSKLRRILSQTATWIQETLQQRHRMITSFLHCFRIEQIE